MRHDRTARSGRGANHRETALAFGWSFFAGPNGGGALDRRTTREQSRMATVAR